MGKNERLVVLKFGGSSLADNEKLNLVSKKIIEFYNKKYKIVVVVSAQGKTTDKLIIETKELSNMPNKREMDMLLSTGEQKSAAKLSILLNELGYNSISLTGWQSGIYTDNLYQDAKIKNIDSLRIESELNDNKIVIITGFQGINDIGDITTLGRGGSDTTAVALASKLNAEACYIFSDVDGIYSGDPNKIKNTRKLNKISYDEMLELSSEGAKVLHNRCVELGKKYKVPIIAKSTFDDSDGTIIESNIEQTEIKSIIKKDDISRISFIGYGIINNNKILKEILEISDEESLKLLNIEVTSSKISIVFNTKVSDLVLEKFHNRLILH